MLIKYKEQQNVERGFAFLKDPWFFADSIFLKSPRRIETMAMLMGLWQDGLFSGTKRGSSPIIYG